MQNGIMLECTLFYDRELTNYGIIIMQHKSALKKEL